MRTRTHERAYEAVKRGFAYVVQNERGRYFSEGKWDILGLPLTDGYDAFDWMQKQDWCNGKIGTLGCSSTAEWQMAVASMKHPALVAMVPQAFGAGVGKVCITNCIFCLNYLLPHACPYGCFSLGTRNKR